MKKYSFVILLCLYQEIKAQDITIIEFPNEIFKKIKKEADTSTWKWKSGGLVRANLTQGSLSNWAAGGDNFSMAVNANMNFYVFHRRKKYTWDNSFDFNFGFIQASRIGSKKNDDRIDFLSKYDYRVDSTNKWYASALYDFRSQLFDGYNFSGGTSNFSSTLLSPAYIILSIGMDYKPTTDFSFFLSPLTSRWVIIANQFLSKKGLYGVPAGKKITNELGMFATINYSTILAKNITYRGRLDLFSSYKNNPGNVDVFFTNLFSFKINKWFSATYNLDMIYDDDIKIFGAEKKSPGLQVKSLIGVGFLIQLTPKKYK